MAHSLCFPRKLNARPVGCQSLHGAHMSTLLAVDKISGKIRKARDVQDAEHIIGLRKTKDPWTVIEALIQTWIKRSPGEFEGFKIHLKDIKETRLDPKFGQTRSKNQDRRLTVVFPLKLQGMIRSVYTAEELPFNRGFFREFARRFRCFQIPDKI